MSKFWDDMTKQKTLVEIRAAQEAGGTRKSLRISQAAELRRAITMLKEENFALRKENNALRDMIALGQSYKTDGLYDLLEIVANHYGVTTASLVSKSRATDYRKARCVFVILARHNGYSLKGIGHALGHRNHSTIINIYDTSRKYLSKEDFAFIQSF